MRSRLIVWLTWGVTSLALLAPARAEAPGTVTVSGRVIGASGSHTVSVALWDAGGFLRQPTDGIRIAKGADTHFRFVVRPGRWALSAYEDRNENGTLDMGMFGPKEPSGFWHPFSGWHKPRFEEVAATVDRDVASADITLK